MRQPTGQQIENSRVYKNKAQGDRQFSPAQRVFLEALLKHGYLSEEAIDNRYYQGSTEHRWSTFPVKMVCSHITLWYKPLPQVGEVAWCHGCNDYSEAC